MAHVICEAVTARGWSRAALRSVITPLLNYAAYQGSPFHLVSEAPTARPRDGLTQNRSPVACAHSKTRIVRQFSVNSADRPSPGEAPEPPEVRQQSIRRHRPRPVVGTEVGIRTAVDEKNAPT